MEKGTNLKGIKLGLKESLKRAGEKWKKKTGKKNLRGFKDSRVYKQINTIYDKKAALLTGKDLSGNPLKVQPTAPRSKVTDFKRFKNKTEARNYYDEKERSAAERWKKRTGKKNLRGFKKSIAYIGIQHHRAKAVDFFDSERKRNDNVITTIKRSPHFSNFSSGGKIMTDLFAKQGFFGDEMKITVKSNIQGHEFKYVFDSYSDFMLKYPEIYERMEDIKEDSGYYPSTSYKFFDRGTDNYANILIQ